MKILYNIGIHLFEFLCKIVALFNKKVRLMLSGQKQTYSKLQTLGKDKKVAWFHCASLGEFEQARNLIEYFKAKYPDYQILVSFFSPSGYEIRKNYNLADCVVYLPFDTKRKARKFISMAHPNIVFFVKYEFWYNYIRELKNVPLYQVSLILRNNHYLLKTYSAWFRKQLKSFNHFFVQNQQTKDILNKIGYTNVTISGDTRFDRVYKMSQEKKDFPIIESFCQTDEKIFVAGSSWPPDEQILANVLNQKNYKLIIAPHLIDQAHIDNLLSLFPNSIAYSKANEENVKEKKVLIIDCIGILSYLYRFADLVHIGGGFGEGIHNVLEAAVFYKPVSLGPNHTKFQEAMDLISLGAACPIKEDTDLKYWLEKLENENIYSSLCQKSGEYVKSHVGATETILKTI